jgi:[acyl-carrier-protein] S-malonyltransferase
MKTAFLFPGQGAQYPGMARDLFDASPAVRDLFALAADSTGIDVQRLLFEGTEEELKETVNTQVSVTLANLSSALVLADRGIRADGTAGFSLGEYAALVEAGVLTPAQVFPLVKLRGELMSKAAAALDRSAGDPGMAAVLGLSPEKVDEALAAASIPDLYGANYNSPNQVVISGTAAALAAGIDALKAAGARRVVTLKVSGPFHSPLLSEASQALEAALKSVEFANPKKALFSNVTGTLVTSGADAKALAVRQVTAPVRWTTEEKALLDAGFTRFIEAGPGAVLAGLWGSFHDALPCHAAGKLEQIQQIG